MRQGALPGTPQRYGRELTVSFKPRILIVEDDEKLRETLVSTLTQMGAEAVAVQESKDGIAYITTEKFDGFFIECRMPGVDGLHLAKMVRASGPNKSCPLVMLANGDDKNALQESFKSGAHFFLQKPVTPVQIRRLMNASHGMMLEERRRYQRAPADFTILVKWGPKEIKGKCLDLSASGMLAELPEGPSRGEKVVIEMTLPPGDQKTLKVEAEVTRVIEGGKLGLQFTGLVHEQKKQIIEFTNRALGLA